MATPSRVVGTMQTMNSASSKPPSVGIRILLLVLGIGSLIGSTLVLAGNQFGYFCIPLLVTAFLVLHILGTQEQP
jgi:uncharacterized membrane protein YphA (DoxX/SURF4 family)